MKPIQATTNSRKSLADLRPQSGKVKGVMPQEPTRNFQQELQACLNLAPR